MLRDILTVKHPSECEFIIHAYPWKTLEQKARRSVLIRVKCDDIEQRDEWTEAILNRLDSKLQPSEGMIIVILNTFYLY